MPSRRKSFEDFIARIKKCSRNGGPACHFKDAEIMSLLEMFQELIGHNPRDKMDRFVFRNELHKKFGITDDFLMDRVFRAFDRDNDGYLKAEEWVQGLSIFLRGDLSDQVKYCFCVYDLNGDGIISREEMFHLLKQTLLKQSTEEDPDEGVKELVEMIMKKLDHDHDGRCSLSDFQKAVEQDSLLLECLGCCLPHHGAISEFLALIGSPHCSVHGGRGSRGQGGSGGSGGRAGSGGRGGREGSGKHQHQEEQLQIQQRKQ